MKVPEAAIPRATLLFAGYQQGIRAVRDFERYMEGLQAGLGLEGAWNLNTATWEFAKIETPETEDTGSSNEEVDE